ncbi:hypothetical protein RRG08_022912 [Elysia crispata]|uniref:Protein sleepless n=1 Tax=Elysia crispata TaxID=231223 RepID=A0AAE1CJN7_9GAST|nr:hypothetical protein RRG08_022912 [Elysia crispata]
MRRGASGELGQILTAATMWTLDIRLVILAMIFCLGDALLCYSCDNLSNPACNQYFMAYQFRAITCPIKPNGDKPLCGKQQQPPLLNGWVGVIRSCYYPGDLMDMNETLGCHNHMIVDTNFSAIYCLCDRDLCNGATPARSGLHFRRSSSAWFFPTHALNFLLSTTLACPVFLTGSVFVRFLLEI